MKNYNLNEEAYNAFEKARQALWDEMEAYGVSDDFYKRRKYER